jgi:hypothetical protein
LADGQDRAAAQFTELTLGDGTWTESGRDDSFGSHGTYTEPSGIDISSDYGDPPAGLAGPFVSLLDEEDGNWIYGWSQAGDTLTLTRYAERKGMGLRWTSPPVIIQLVRAPAVPVGTWTADDSAAAGFDTLTLGADGTYTETGHTPDIADDDGGPYTTPGSIDIFPDFGLPPAGMTGPYISLTDTQDGQWVYRYVVTNGELTLTRYAERRGQGLRWVDPPVVLHLH